MNETQRTAFDIWLDSASYENDYKPISEAELARQLNDMGLEASSSSINRWKAKFNWGAALESKITLALNTNKDLANLAQKSSLESAVKNTKVDIERNSVLIAASYELMEAEAKRLLEVQKEQGGLKNKNDIELFKFIATTATTRHDKMLDRQAMMGAERISSAEVLARLSEINVEIEEAEVIDD